MPTHARSRGRAAAPRRRCDRRWKRARAARARWWCTDWPCRRRRRRGFARGAPVRFPPTEAERRRRPTAPRAWVHLDRARRAKDHDPRRRELRKPVPPPALPRDRWPAQRAKLSRRLAPARRWQVDRFQFELRCPCFRRAEISASTPEATLASLSPILTTRSTPDAPPKDQTHRLLLVACRSLLAARRSSWARRAPSQMRRQIILRAHGMLVTAECDHRRCVDESECRRAVRRAFGFGGCAAPPAHGQRVRSSVDGRGCGAFVPLLKKRASLFREVL